jgi:hypothetical protein
MAAVALYASDQHVQKALAVHPGCPAEKLFFE